MRLKSADIAGFHEYSSSNNNMARDTLKLKPNIFIQYKKPWKFFVTKSQNSKTWGQKKKKLEQLKKDDAACNFHLQKDRLRKAVKKVIFHLVDKLKGLWCTATHFFIFFNSFEITIATTYYLKSG